MMSGGQPPRSIGGEMMNTRIVRSGLRIPFELNTWLILEAKRMGIPKNALILQILRDWVKQNEEKGEKR